MFYVPAHNGVNRPRNSLSLCSVRDKKRYKTASIRKTLHSIAQKIYFVTQVAFPAHGFNKKSALKGIYLRQLTNQIFLNIN